MLTIDDRPRGVARFGLNVADVQAVVATALAGTEAGEVFEGDRRFDIVVRLPEDPRATSHALRDLPVPCPRRGGPRRAGSRCCGRHAPSDRTEFVPLGSGGAASSSRRAPTRSAARTAKRRVVVQANVRGRDLGGFVAEAQRRVAREVKLPAGSWIDLGRPVREPDRRAQRGSRSWCRSRCC